MKTYLYNEPIFNEHGDIIDNEVREITEKQILSDYWPWWKPRMIKNHGLKSVLITDQNCIDDWVVSNMAWEKNDAEQYKLFEE